MAGPDSKIGTVRIDAEVDVSKAEEQLESLKQTAEETGEKVVESTDNASDGFGKFGKDVENNTEKAGKSFSKMTEKLQADVSRQVGAITGLVGSFTAVVGVATLFYNIGNKIGKMLFEQTDHAKKLREELDKLPASYRNLTESHAAEEAEAIERLALQNSALQQRLDGFRKGANEFNLTLEELLQERNRIETKYNNIAQSQSQIITGEDGLKRLGFLSGPEARERFASEAEKDIFAYASGIKKAYAAARAEIEDSQSAVDRAAAESIRDAAATRFRTELDNFIAEANAVREATLAELNARNRAIEDQLLGPLEAQERSLVERLAELNQLLRSSTDGEIKDAAARQVELLDEVLGNLRQQMKGSEETTKELREMPDKVEASVSRALDRFAEKAGLLQINQTLGAINANQDRLADEFSRLQ